MQPNTPLNRVPREDLPSHMQSSWDAAMAMHGDTTFVEVAGNNPTMYDWYIEDFYKIINSERQVNRRIVKACLGK